MRLNVVNGLTWAVVVGLPVCVLVFLGHGTAGACYALAVPLLCWAFRLACLFSKKGGAPVYRLYSIQLSHYVEKIRWLLDAEQLAYEEEVDCGIVGVLFGGRMVPQLERRAPGGLLPSLCIENSSDIVAHLAGAHPDSRLLASGADAEVRRLLADWDRFGRSVQVSVYARLLGGASFATYKDVAMQLWGRHPEFAQLTPAWQRLLMPLLWPLLRAFVRSAFQLASTQAVAKADAHIADTLQRVSDRLADGRQFIMGGDAMTVADVAFCALASPLVLPPNYGGFAMNRTMYELAKQAPDVVELVERCRATPAGRWVLQTYATSRPRRQARQV